MLGFARETKLSETTFLQAGDQGADYRTRIWMTGGELPFAGHPSLGTAVAVAHLRGERSARYVQRTGAGLQPVDVELAGLRARASMLQEPVVFGIELDAGEALGAAGLGVRDAMSDLPCQVVSTGVEQVVAPLASAAALARARPDPAAVEALLSRTGAITLYLAVCGEHRAQARSFFCSPGGLVEEDPATGSAAGPLMAYLHARTGATSLAIDQGVQMGRASRLDCTVEGERVRVGGEAVIVATGTLHL